MAILRAVDLAIEPQAAAQCAPDDSAEAALELLPASTCGAPRPYDRSIVTRRGGRQLSCGYNTIMRGSSALLRAVV